MDMRNPQACTTFVGQNYGAGKGDRCRRTLNWRFFYSGGLLGHRDLRCAAHMDLNGVQAVTVLYDGHAACRFILILCEKTRLSQGLCLDKAVKSWTGNSFQYIIVLKNEWRIS